MLRHCKVGEEHLKRAAPMSAVNENGFFVSFASLESWSESSDPSIGEVLKEFLRIH